MPDKRWLLLIFPGLIVAFILWWFLGHAQPWIALHTGTDNCANLPPKSLPVCRYYGFWSGFGSDLGEYVIVASFASSLVILWRTNTCPAKWWCWRRPAHPLQGNEHFKLCSVHHPDTHMSLAEAVRHHCNIRGLEEKIERLEHRRAQTDG